ncbi:terminase small subunit [Desulfobaculum bizertense]|uniref:Phage terminase small subunit n=1 Tax=Desulfobaculum bizertense DSM 18034 TaxID=1121442 RepID=A0A1T4VGQ6_9BACT|nr:terminase small subunit [Desulfobaculum bizertense]SKA64127.1 phage terminase small subunit [Desulfobaculum bizertense DSM 18034]
MIQKDGLRMTPRQERFAAEYAVSGDAEEAALRAGYSEKTAKQTGKRWLADERIQKAVAAFQDDSTAHDAVTRQWVIARLKDVAERCMQAVAVSSGKGENAVTEYRFDASNANRALSLLGKYLHMFNEKPESTAETHEDTLDSLE